MQTRIRKVLSLPAFPDDEQMRIARLLNMLLWALIVFMMLDALLLLVFAPETRPTFWMNGAVIAIALVMHWLLRRGYVRFSSLCLCSLIWPLTVYYISESGG